MHIGIRLILYTVTLLTCLSRFGFKFKAKLAIEKHHHTPQPNKNNSKVYVTCIFI